jgi:hypothetical protein
MTTTITTSTMFVLKATQERDGQRIGANHPEVLGDATFTTYTTEAQAESVRDTMQGEVRDFDLDPSTVYTVEQVTVYLRDLAFDATDSGEEGRTVCSATVEIDGDSHDTRWFASNRHTSNGIDGLIPEGESIDCWADPGILATFGVKVANVIGLEILAHG